MLQYVKMFAGFLYVWVKIDPMVNLAAFLNFFRQLKNYFNSIPDFIIFKKI